MKLAVDPENIACAEVDKLASDDLIKEIADILSLDRSLHNELQKTLQKIYQEFLTGYYDIKRALPEHIESQALIEVRDKAKDLYQAIMNLYEFGNTDQRFADALVNIDHDDFMPEQGKGIWKKLITDWNPNIFLRHLIVDIEVAADKAADSPDKNMTVEELKNAIKNAKSPQEKEEFEHQLFFAEWSVERDPNRHEEYKKRVFARKTPKDLPIRNSVNIFKKFFDNYVEHPFTAGKYYSEIGFKSPAFYAVKIALKKIYPDVSDRKIASIMQEL